LARACGGDRGVDVEPEREVGLQPGVDPAFEVAQHALVLAAAGALVRERRVGEAVAQDGVAARQRRHDHAVEVVAARGEDEQRLDDAVHLLVQQQLAQVLGERRPTRLARADDAPTACAQARGERLDVRRLAGAVDPLEGDEPAVHCGCAFRW
jgi:hypothetical protein